MARGKVDNRRLQIVHALRNMLKHNGLPDYQRVARLYGVHERTVRRYVFQVEHSIVSRPVGRAPLPGNTPVGVAKKLLRLPSYKRRWPLRRLAEEMKMDKSTLQRALQEALRYVKGASTCEVKCSVTDCEFYMMILRDLKESTQSIWVSMFALTHNDYVQVLIDKHSAGVDVKIIIDIIWARQTPAGRTAAIRLIEAGVAVKFQLDGSSRNSEQ
ncbi:Hypothetical protein PHPALM_19984 [Phytophthora palmivora]|uniref:Phospholipase D-like domain-containing protein n=1 Tax=Phytophthora palmivora TaxID=4796 RepID=A0A2P4XG13_9STRA|nr:Hypothetical protein PHPALM_19984 [Phytophthora palmivora]